MASLHTLLVAVLLAGPEAAQRPGPAQAPAPAVLDLPRLREVLYLRGQPQEQSQAALLLVQSQHVEAAEHIREGLRRWDRPDVFQALASAIRIHRDTRHEALLLRAIHSEQVPIRQAASEALPRLENPLLTRKLLAIAEDQSASLAARQSAVQVLGGCIQKSAAHGLLTLLSSDSASIRQAAGQALETLTGQGYGANALLWQEWWRPHEELSDEQWLVHRTSYFADRSRRLQDELVRAENQILQLQRDLFQKVPPAERVTHLSALLQNEYPGVRMQTVAWIGESVPEADSTTRQKLSELLLKLTEDGFEQVQRQAVLALEKVSDTRVFERLTLLLDTGSVNVRAAAARSLGRYRAERTPEGIALNMRAIAALEKALSDTSLFVVAEAAASLGSMGAPEAAPVLARLLQHPSDPVRLAAAQALEQLDNPTILPELYQGLYDPVGSVRFSLVGALGKTAASGRLKEAEVAGVARRLSDTLLRDSDPGVRSRAATVIGDLGGPSDLPLLFERTRATEDNRVQVKAWSALVEIIARSQSWTLLLQWDQQLAAKEPGRRVELLTELRTRWNRVDALKPQQDALTNLLIEALLQQRRWLQAQPLAVELARKETDPADQQKRLRHLLVIAQMALDDKKPQGALDLLKSIDDLLPRSRDLAPEFEAVRQRALKANE
jgi:HEAT repeat protein